MNNALPLGIAASLITLAMAVLVRTRRKRTPLERLRLSIEEALEDAQKQVRGLRMEARKLHGDARKRLEKQAHDVEALQKDLRARLDDLKSDAGRLLEHAHA